MFKVFWAFATFLLQTCVFYLLYNSNCAGGHGNHWGNGIVSLWTKLCDLLDVNWMKKKQQLFILVSFL